MVAAGISLYLYIKKRSTLSEWKSLEFLLPLMLIIQSLIQFSGKPLLSLIYIPFIVVISSYFHFKVIIGCMMAILFLGLPNLLWSKGYLAQEGGIYLSILVTGIVSCFMFYRATKISKKAVKDLDELKSSALNLEASTESSLLDEDRFSFLLKSIFETQKELDTMINFTKKLTEADSAALFVLEGDNLVLKSSTENVSPELTHADRGYLLEIIKGKKTIIQPKFKGGFFELRYSHPEDIGSFLCVPVLDGDIPIGILIVDSSRENAFGEREKETAVEFALQINQILSRTRTYIEVERFARGFKGLHDASKELSSSLKVEDIAEKFVERVSGMLSSSAIGFFITDKGKLRVIAKKGFEPEKESFYPKGTYFDLIIRNKHQLHFSHLHKKDGIFPFKTTEAKSFLGIPVMSENEVIGIIALTSKEPDTISSFQVYIIKTLADQVGLYINNAQLHKEVEKLAITDGLTGLYNHKYFQERLSEEFKRIKRIPQPLSLMLIDIDHFKKINDAYGHPAGDTVLENIALILKKALRGIDILARYGGEEFAAVLVGTGGNGAKKMAERFRASMVKNPFFINEHKLTVTVSIGIATYPHDVVTKDNLIDRADQALYYAKKSGRNQVCEWKEVAKTL